MKNYFKRFLGAVLTFAIILSAFSGVFAATDDRGFEKKYSFTTSDYFKEEYSTYTISGTNLQFDCAVTQGTIPYVGYAFADFPQNEELTPGTYVKVFGTVSESGKFSGSADLSKLPDGDNLFYLMFAKAGEEQYSGKSSILVTKRGNDCYFKTNKTNIANDDFTKFLNMLNPNTCLSLKNLSGNDLISDKAKSIVSGINNTYDKILAIHDWVADNIYYNFDAINSGLTGNNRPDNVFSTKIAVCQGYAEMMNFMLRSLGIPSVWVGGFSSTAGYNWDNYDVFKDRSNHAWSAAYVDGRWMTIDSTWDSGNRYENNKKTHNDFSRSFFDITNQSLSLDHRTNELYNTYAKFDQILYSFQDGFITADSYEGIDNEIILPDFVKSIDTNAIPIFVNEITLPQSVQYIADNAIPKTTTIKCTKGSYAHKYAQENGYDFVLIIDNIIEISSLGFSQNSFSCELGKTLQLTATIFPSNATDKTLKWESSEPEIVSVDEKGVVTAKKSGNAVITVSTPDSKISATCILTAFKKDEIVEISSITFAEEIYYLEIGKSTPSSISILPLNSTEKTVTFTSSNPNAITVSPDGLITAKKLGEATITASSKDGTVKGSCTVKTFVFSDVNGDGKFNTLDSLSVLKFAASMIKLLDLQKAAADFNGDGEVDTRDSLAMLKKIAQIS